MAKARFIIQLTDGERRLAQEKKKSEQIKGQAIALVKEPSSIESINQKLNFIVKTLYDLHK